MNKNKITLAALFAGSIFALTACGNTDTPTEPTPEPPIATGDEAPATPLEGSVVHDIHPGLVALDQLSAIYPSYFTNNNPILQPGDPGNIIRAMVASTGTFPGTFEITHQSEAFDNSISSLQNVPLVFVDETFMFTDSGPATLTFDNANYAIQIDLNHDIYWHDGLPVTLDDLVFAYELIAHPEHNGQRFVSAHFIPYVVGVDEFREGTADYISGLVLSNNNRTLRIYYTQPLPPAAQYIGGIWLNITPRHWLTPALEEVGMNELINHPRVRHEALGNGPWIIDTVVPGESVLFRANDNYWRGRPNIDYLLWEIVPNELALASLREGLYDLTIHFLPNHFYEEHQLTNPNNYRFVSVPAAGFGFMYFRTGTMEADAEGIIATPRPDGHHPIQNVAVRRALAHSMDMALKAATIQNGLSVPAGSILSPFNARSFINPNVTGFFFDLDLANQILDDAGFTERGSDGFRLNLDGTPMHFNAAFNDNEFNRLATPTFLQNWQSIGLDVRLYTNDLIEWNTFLDNVLLSDNWSDTVHILLANWNASGNPSPTTLWHYRNNFNLSRHNTPEFRSILDDIVSPQAFDSAFLANSYDRWQTYMYENAVAAPLFWSIQLFAVNNRVSGFDITRRDGYMSLAENSHLWGLTAPQAYVYTN